MNPFPLVGAMLRRNAGTSTAFVVLIALAVGLAAAITAQERALRQGSARASDRFDLVVAAPGSHTDLLLKVVFLQPGSVELLQGEALQRLMSETRSEFVAPIAFGDSHDGDPVVGTIPAFVVHLAEGEIEGRVFSAIDEAVVGAKSSLAIGENLTVTHGHGAEALLGHRHGQSLTVVGRLPATGSPWDRAVVVPVEFVWQVHGLGTGHEGDDPSDSGAHAGETDGHEEHHHRIGPPFDLTAMPGIPAAILKPASLQDAYGLRNAWRTAETTAFFPAEVLVQLYELLGDIRNVMSALAVATEVLLVASVLAGILILMRLYRHRFAVLRALGASRFYVFAVAWSFSFALILTGSLLGLAVALGLTGAASEVLEAQSGLELAASIGPSEFGLALAVSVAGAILAVAPAALIYRDPVVVTLRAVADA